ncbi:sugar ABC transporter substrate-binding protein [Butyrivibrio sp. X503]|uniref:sugar ABC transporter substrate-binding protein n=1 Tax=Butyrivibrio sp. X503 TaxID=2364878 RepID=UPI000EA932B8|nr:extracellular solute-binding protein [Butyrivibrio sp. X503]RKM55620.1 sugar ABC transporter substrate-binding protein [Butyrivibrio sp. X503]
MKLRTRIFSIILILCTVLGAVLYAQSGQSIFEEHALFTGGKTTVRVWYTDDALTPYLQSKAVAYSETMSKVRIEPTLVSGIEYLEAINKASLKNSNYPDLFIITNDSLEKAYLAGLALEIDNSGNFLNDESFPKAAVDSVTYNGRYIGYPFYFETSSLVYNKTYLENMAKEQLETQKELESLPDQSPDAAEAMAEEEAAEAMEAEEEEIENSISEEAVEETVSDSIPNTISGILSFAQNYNAPDQVEAVFKWDVTDIFYNYFFVGNYMNVGGDAGDDVSQIDIYNTDTISCMKIYQQLNQFFAIDSKSVDYDSVVQDFIDGKIVFTVATTDILRRIEEAKAKGECEFDFGVADMPGLTGDFKTRTMSVTECIVVNGYSEHPYEANAFAKYLCKDNSGDIYKMSGKLAAHYNVKYGNPNLDTFVDVYADSVPMPKTIETSNLWMELEIAFTEIWNGADCNGTLKQVSENIMTQVTGKDYSEESIPDPNDDVITAGLKEESD